MIKDFMENAKNFISNPLGIIALFITLIYGVVCIVFPSFILSLEIGLQIALVSFIIVFPILTLGSFVYLVIKHHRKLYAPKDYQNENNFMVDYLSSYEKNNKIDNDMLDSSNSPNEAVSNEEKDVNQNNSAKSDMNILKKENGSQQIETITSNLEFSNSTGIYNNRVVTRKDFILLEEIALRKWERENKMFIQRQVKLHLTDSIDLEVDGIGTKKDITYIFEINIIKDNIISPSIQSKLSRMINIVLNEKNYKMVFIVIHKKGYGKELELQLFKIHNKKSDRFCFAFYSQESLFKEYEIE